MRVLIVGIDWHGDVAQALRAGFRSNGVDAEVAYVLRQRRRGLIPRIEDELLSVKPLASRVRGLQRRRVLEATRTAVAAAKPTLTVCLCPDLLPEAAVEIIAGRSTACWWFADDPFDYARRGLPGPPAALDHSQGSDALALVAHPGWARGPLAAAQYLPYGGRFEPREPAHRESVTPRYPCAVVGSPRAERAELLGQLERLIGPALNVWGWGARGRLPTNSRTRPFRRRLRGWGVLGAEGVERVYRSAGVVLNLQDRQMLGAWNPQTFDLMALGVPQVVWNSEPVDYLENPPPYADSAEGLAKLVVERLSGDPADDRLEAAFAEARRRHTWRHRAAEIAALA